jgi:phosphohistidine swiveling domain-containing protein
MDYSKINSENYDFLWKVGGVTYLYLSIWLNKEYQKRDFVVTNEKDLHNFFVSKGERKKLAKEGLQFFLEGFSAYKEEMTKEFEITEKFLNDLNNTDLAKLSNTELAESFNKAADYVQKMWADYFWTEYFMLDEVAKIIEENDSNYDVAFLKERVQEMGDLKYKQRSYINKTLYPPSIMEKYYGVIESNLSLSEKDLQQYSYKEIVSMLNGESVTFSTDRSLFIKGQFSDWKEITGDAARTILKQLLQFDPNTKILKGSIGNKGFYKGRVKKIEFSTDTDFVKEINDMQKGDVLVSGSTGPEMILACQKAGAIVTDEGGITSHAAIVSRELKIPSVIGTKYATRILNTGDMVEVDAEKGIVKILQ